MPKKKAELKREIARLSGELSKARAELVELQLAAASREQQHRVELIIERYRLMLENLEAQDATSVSAAASSSSSAGVVTEVVTPAVVASPTASSDVDSLALEVLQAQVADLQQRLTDAQRTIEMLVVRVLDMSRGPASAPSSSSSPDAAASAYPRAVGDGEVRTIRFPLTRES